MKIFIKKSPINTDFRELCISQQNTKTLIFLEFLRKTQRDSKPLKALFYGVSGGFLFVLKSSGQC